MCIVSYIASWKLLSFNVFCFLKIIRFDYVHNPRSTLATHRSICAPNGISVQACRTCARQPHAYFSQSTLCAPASHKGCSAQKNTCVPTFHKMHLRTRLFMHVKYTYVLTFYGVNLRTCFPQSTLVVPLLLLLLCHVLLIHMVLETKYNIIKHSIGNSVHKVHL